MRFFVAGTPSTKGSARAIPYRGKDGRMHAAVKNDAGDKAKTWAACVSAAAHVAAKGAPPLRGAVVVHLTFHLPRPKGHYTASGKLRPKAPAVPAVKPDGDKLERCTWDALSGIAFADDAAIVTWSGFKLYASGPTGCTIEVRPWGAA